MPASPGLCGRRLNRCKGLNRCRPHTKPDHNIDEADITHAFGVEKGPGNLGASLNSPPSFRSVPGRFFSRKITRNSEFLPGLKPWVSFGGIYDRNTEVYDKMVSGLENVKDVHHKIADFKDFQIIGHGIASGPEYPQYEEDLNRVKKKGNPEEIKKDYEEGKEKVFSLFESANKPVIFLSHNVPFNTKVDMIAWEGSPRKGQHFGSLIAREACDKYQPVVCIGGHMHEHHDKDILGKTVVINAGFGSAVNTLLEVEGST